MSSSYFEHWPSALCVCGFEVGVLTAGLGDRRSSIKGDKKNSENYKNLKNYKDLYTPIKTYNNFKSP